MPHIGGMALGCVQAMRRHGVCLLCRLRTSVTASLLMLPCSIAPGTQGGRRLTWSCIRDSRGDTTTTRPGQHSSNSIHTCCQQQVVSTPPVTACTSRDQHAASDGFVLRTRQPAGLDAPHTPCCALAFCQSAATARTWRALPCSSSAGSW